MKKIAFGILLATIVMLNVALSLKHAEVRQLEAELKESVTCEVQA